MKNLHKLALGAVLLAGLSLQACGGDKDDDKDDDTGSGGGGFIPPEGGAPGTGGTGGNGEGGDPNPGAGGTIVIIPKRPDCPTEPDGTQDSAAIDGDACWKLDNCNVTDLQQVLQRCNTNCYPFDDTGDRITGWSAGEPLPELP